MGDKSPAQPHFHVPIEQPVNETAWTTCYQRILPLITTIHLRKRFNIYYVLYLVDINLILHAANENSVPTPLSCLQGCQQHFTWNRVVIRHHKTFYYYSVKHQYFFPRFSYHLQVENDMNAEIIMNGFWMHY